MSEKHIFTKTKRDGRIALWVNFPNGEDYNIWDLSQKELTHDVEKAIISAFERGVEYQCQKIAKANLRSFIAHTTFKDSTND